jgi:hypothetical protein
VNVTEEERLFGLAGHPLAQSIPGFKAQYPPDLNWPELHANQSHIMLMMDVGWGKLAYLAIDFPRDTKVRKGKYLKNFFGILRTSLFLKSILISKLMIKT